MNKTAQRSPTSVRSTYNAAKIGIISKTQKLLLPQIKGDQPTGAKSNCIHVFTCNCGSSYISRTNRWLDPRIEEHLPEWVERVTGTGFVAGIARRFPASSIEQHVLTSGGRTDPGNSFMNLLSHLIPHVPHFAEAVAIKRLYLLLCVQKQLLVNLTYVDRREFLTSETIRLA